MESARFQFIFFAFLIGAVFALNFFMFLPYLSILFLAAVLTLVFYPIYTYILKLCRGRVGVSAGISTLMVFLIIFGPVSFLGTIFFNQIAYLYHGVTTMTPESIASSQFAPLVRGIEQHFPSINIPRIEHEVQVYVGATLAWILSHASGVFSGAVYIAFQLLLMFFAVFYFFRDGKKLIAVLIRVSPLHDVDDKHIIDYVAGGIHSVVVGYILIGLIQGVLVTGLMKLFSVPNPIMLGVISAIAAFIPNVGANIALVPAVLFVYFSYGTIPAIILAVFGLILLLFIAQILGPVLMNRSTKIHPFLILLSVVGGVTMFGLIGFLAGPVILSILFALFNIYPAVTGVKRKGNSVKRSARIF